MPTALKAHLDQLDALTAEHAALYKPVEDGDGFDLDLDLYAEFVKKPISKKNKELLAKQSKLKKFEALAEEDIAAVEEFLAKRKDGTEDKDEDEDDEDPPVTTSKKKGADPVADAKATYQERLAALKKKHRDDLARKDQELEVERQKFENHRLTDFLTTHGIESKVLNDRFDPWKKTVSPYFRQENGKTVFLDDDGEPSDLQSKEEIADYLKKKYPYFYEGVADGGSGAGAESKKPDGTIPKKKKSEYTDAERNAVIAKGGYDAWEKLT